jgi:tetratricopeptide (TPR) repeat protein
MDKFPFPGSGAANSSSAPGLGLDAPAAPDAPAPNPPSGPSPTDAAKKFPFPGESPAEPAASGDLPGAPAAGSSSSSSSSSSDAPGDLPGDSSPDLKDAGSEGSQTRPSGHILHRAAPAAPKPQTADEREEEDLRVANFNLDRGNVPGAYMRARDAVKTAPDDPEAHFALAETAAKLGKKDEAIAEYNACLKLDPPEDRKKDSTKALARLAK